MGQYAYGTTPNLSGIRFDKLTANDIGEVNDLYDEEYGEYPYPIQTADRPGVFIVVRDTTTNQVVAFARAASYHGYEEIYEFGGLIVRETHRGRGIARALTVARLTASASQGAIGGVSETVCFRKDRASQRNLIKAGFILTALTPLRYPDLRPEFGHQPESVALAVKFFARTHRFGTRTLHLPDDYKGALMQALPGAIQRRPWDTTHITNMPAPTVHQALTNEHTGCELVDVPANWKESKAVINAFRADGWLFCGVLPSFGDPLPNGSRYDLVRLYRPAKRDGMDFRRIHVVPQIASLHQFAQREIQRHAASQAA